VVIGSHGRAIGSRLRRFRPAGEFDSSTGVGRVVRRTSRILTICDDGNGRPSLKRELRGGNVARRATALN